MEIVNALLEFMISRSISLVLSYLKKKSIGVNKFLSTFLCVKLRKMFCCCCYLFVSPDKRNLANDRLYFCFDVKTCHDQMTKQGS